MTNVARHARASAYLCVSSFDRAAALTSTSPTTAAGMPADTPAGVGLTAMRERAAELGGHLSITSAAAGTYCRPALPIPELP